MRSARGDLPTSSSLLPLSLSFFLKKNVTTHVEVSEIQVELTPQTASSHSLSSYRWSLQLKSRIMSMVCELSYKLFFNDMSSQPI